MKASEVIAALQEEMKRVGDLEVTNSDGESVTSVSVDTIIGDDDVNRHDIDVITVYFGELD
jgi:hypothetical protein